MGSSQCLQEGPKIAVRHVRKSNWRFAGLVLGSAGQGEGKRLLAGRSEPAGGHIISALWTVGVVFMDSPLVPGDNSPSR